MDGMDQKKAQVRNMQEYIAGCQAFFEKVLTDLLLRQPSDPAEFLLETINNMPPEEKALWTKKVTNKAIAAATESNKGSGPPALLGGGSGEMKSVAYTRDTVQVVLRLDLNPGNDIQKACLDVLQNLKESGCKLNGCQQFEIFVETKQEDSDANSVCVLQTWANQDALDNYYAQDFFTAATPAFAGLLSGPPEYRSYTPTR